MAEALAQKMVEEKCKNMEENYKKMREEQDNARSSKRR
jgi:CRISPR/Cas system-associated endonuclease Cas1